MSLRHKINDNKERDNKHHVACMCVVWATWQRVEVGNRMIGTYFVYFPEK